MAECSNDWYDKLPGENKNIPADCHEEERGLAGMRRTTKITAASQSLKVFCLRLFYIFIALPAAQMTSYTYTTSTDFITTLTFDYVETYSFQRGAAFEKDRKEIQNEFGKLKARKEKRNNLIESEEERYVELNSLLSFTQYLLNDKGQFHPSAQKTNTFRSNDPNIDRVKNILLTEVVDIPQWLCAPVYRDAIVFYDKDSTIITTLNICLSCQYMETKMFNHINGDFKTYDLFKHFFIDIGHEVEAQNII